MTPGAILKQGSVYNNNDNNNCNKYAQALHNFL
jgi:hypothetical protein